MSAPLATLKQLQAVGFFRPLDVQLAGLADRMIGGAEASLLFAVALASRAVGEGNACADLAEWAGLSLAEQAATRRSFGWNEAEAASAAIDAVAATLPAWETWREVLTAPGARPVIGGADERTLLVLNKSRLYLRRYWDYERRTETHLTELAQARRSEVLPESRLAAYFPDDAAYTESVRQQREAARIAANRRLAILSGGPGTGKTYTLARIVGLLAEQQAPGGEPLRVRLAAPTGKAAARVVESLRQAKEELRRQGFAEAALDAVPESASTIHRLLGSRANSPDFKHDAHNPLAADLVIVDEASMIALPLMAKLLAALPKHGRLMLVGDSRQLASVEPGSVFGDICRAAQPEGALAGCLTMLTVSRRFPADSAIGRVSAALQADTAHAWDVLQAHADGGALTVCDSGDVLRENGRFDAWVRDQFRPYLEARTPESALVAAGACRILCALRNGPYGVSHMNRRVERLLAAMGLNPSGRFYDHRLILVTVNTPALGLDNGDIGVVLETDGRRQAWFAGRDGQPRAIPVSLLPEHETAFAMTVHKAQGSEFPHVALVLPAEGGAPVLTRELVYTGLTRVKIDPRQKSGGVMLFATEAGFVATVGRQIRRTSGLFM